MYWFEDSIFIRPANNLHKQRGKQSHGLRDIFLRIRTKTQVILR